MKEQRLMENAAQPDWSKIASSYDAIAEKIWESPSTLSI